MQGAWEWPGLVNQDLAYNTAKKKKKKKSWLKYDSFTVISCYVFFYNYVNLYILPPSIHPFISPPFSFSKTLSVEDTEWLEWIKSTIYNSRDMGAI